MNKKTLFYTLIITTGITFELVMGYIINNLINEIGNAYELGEILKLIIFFALALSAAVSPLYILYLVISRYLPPAPQRTAPAPRNIPNTNTPVNTAANQGTLRKIILTVLTAIVAFALSALVKAGFNSGQLSGTDQYIGLGVSVVGAIALTIWIWSN